MIPKDSTKLDWGSRARHRHRQPRTLLSKDNALDVVAGYCLANDVSERVFQIERAGQWTKGKGCETFGPLGPWLVTKDEIRTRKISQCGSTSTARSASAAILRHDLRLPPHRLGLLAIFRPGARRRHHHRHAAGVGLGMKPEPKFLKAGDVVTLGIDGLGEQRQKIVKFKSEGANLPLPRAGRGCSP